MEAELSNTERNDIFEAILYTLHSRNRQVEEFPYLKTVRVIFEDKFINITDEILEGIKKINGIPYSQKIMNLFAQYKEAGVISKDGAIVKPELLKEPLDGTKEIAEHICDKL